MPNPASIGFVRLLGRSTRFRRPDGEYAVDPAVPVLGRWLTFFAERAEVPGSCLLLAATQALALHWASGQSAVEDLNLATQLAWINPPAGLTGAEAALAAEDPLTWPPAGPATDPTFDNEVLAPLIRACSRPGISTRRREAAETDLRKELAGQLTPTWNLMWRTVELLRALPPGRTVAGRWESDRDAFTRYCEHLRDGGPPQPRRDSAVAAAGRLNSLERSNASYAAQRAFDDPLVLAQYRLTGEAFGGVVTAAEPDRVDASGKRRKLRPMITVATEDPVRIEAGAAVISPTRPMQSARVMSVSALTASTSVVLELSGGMGRALQAAPGSTENAELRRRLGMNSGNSSVPPSKDPLAAKAGRKARRAAERSSRVRSPDRQPGGRAGHQGSGLTPAAVPDRTETAELPAGCRGCGADLADPGTGASDAGRAWAQVWDILPVTLEKVHWWLPRRRCGAAEGHHCGGAAAQAGSVVYGPASTPRCLLSWRATSRERTALMGAARHAGVGRVRRQGAGPARAAARGRGLRRGDERRPAGRGGLVRRRDPGERDPQGHRPGREAG